MNVSVTFRAKRAKPWSVDWRPKGEPRRRLFFASRREAEAQAGILRLQHENQLHDWLNLNGSERLDLLKIWGEIRAAGLTLRQVWERYRAVPAATPGPLLSKVITELEIAKRGAGRSERYLDSLTAALNQFARGRDIPIGTVTLADVEGFIGSKALASRSTIRSRLSGLFRFAVRRGYITANPCERLEAIRAPKSPPAILTVPQVETCLQCLEAAPRGYAWFVLSTFCGLRPDEARQTRPADIHYKEGWIKVEAQTSKTRQRRVVYPKPEALALLRRALKLGGELPLDEQPKRRVLRRLRDKLGLARWPKDLTRHTAASYWLADCRSAAHVADMLGHSENVLRRHYKALVTEKEAKEFWGAVMKLARKISPT